MNGLLPQQFYARDTLDVARDLLGKLIVHSDVVVKITEVEAYRGPNDTASHCRFGKTDRNAPMWGPPGHAYVYLCYGLHHMLNFVTNAVDEGAAILIRSCQVIEGHTTVSVRRKKPCDSKILVGPGNVAQGLGLDRTFCNHALYKASGLEVRNAPPVSQIWTGPRVGIGYASKVDQDAPWRIAIADSIGS